MKLQADLQSLSIKLSGLMGIFCLVKTLGEMPVKNRKTKDESMRRLYNKLLRTSEIPIIETPDIHSKGFYLSEQGKKEIYIKESLHIKQKLHVLLHEYAHYIHFTHYYQDGTRAESEMIANGSAFLVCQEHGLNISKDVDLSKFSVNTDIITRMTAIIQEVFHHISRQSNLP
ncbi:MAG: hypothetical protein FWE91_10840 [Defluviitaleaceae bacterium]|nr:hypothetical protein [Defluviitaleaceae bacterium]MCL2836320.1 hypothetical protein [Defluviitaleaceae bacterium]